MADIRGRCGKKLPGESRPIDTVAQPCAAQIHAPDEGHAVGYESIEACGQRAESGIVTARSHNMSIGEINAQRAASPAGREKIVAELVVRGCQERGAEQVVGAAGEHGISAAAMR